MRFQAEDRADSAGGVIKEVSVDQPASDKGVKVEVKKGIAIISVPADVKQIEFSGISDPKLHPISAKRAVVSVEVRCQLEEYKKDGK